MTQLPSDHADVALVSSTIDLAHRLGLEIVAEGVESGDALCWLRNNAVDQVQGFYWSEPLSVNDTDEWMANFNGGKICQVRTKEIT